MRGSKRSYIELDDLLCRIEAGKSPMADDSPAGHGEWGVLKVSAIQSGRFVARENKAIRDASLIRSAYEVKPGDLLMTRANTEELVGLACVASTPPPHLMLSDKTLRLVVNESLADPNFLALVLGQPSLRQRIRSLATGTSGSMKNIGQEQIRRLPVPAVPLEEQRRIVAAHEAIERRIAALEPIEAKLKTAQSALAETALTRGQSSLVPLGSIIEAIETGWSPSCDAEPPAADEWGVARVSAVTSGRFKPTEAKRLPSGVNHRPQLEIRSGDVLLARANGARSLVGVVCHVRQTRAKLMLSDKILRLVHDAAVVNPAFLAFMLSTQSVRSQIGALLNGSSGQNNVTQDDVRGLLVPDVPIDEQSRIMAAHEAAELRVGAITKQISKLRVVQEGLLEGLLSGRVRVPH